MKKRFDPALRDQQAHALLGPSSASRWTRCTRSARASEHAPDNKSIHADRGGFIHAMTEFCLLNDLIPDQLCGRPEWEASDFFDKEAREYALFCVEYARDKIEAARRISPDAEVRIEARVNLQTWVPGCFGTADLIIVVDGEMWVIDWKFGAGVKVFAEDNEQAQLYGLGAHRLVGHLYDVQQVHLIIVQPPLDHIDQHDITVDELLAFGEWIKPLAQMAWEGKGDFVPGEKQCKFCRIRSTCKARAESNLKLAESRASQDVHQLSLVEISEILPKLDELISWAQDVQEHALKEATQGKRIPGQKLVEGRSNRKWSNEDNVVAAMRDAGLGDDKIFKRDLIGITAAEKLLGKNSPVFGLTTKAQGRPVLVPLSDKRPELSTGVSDADFDAA